MSKYVAALALSRLNSYDNVEAQYLYDNDLLDEEGRNMVEDINHLKEELKEQV